MEFPNCFVEDLGVLTPGTLKLSDKSINFKSGSKTVNITASDLDDIRWQKLGNKPGLRFAVSDGTAHRFGGFKDSDYEKIAEFAKSNWQQEIEKKELVIKGWNYGNVDVRGKNIEFTWENNPVFEIPCTAVSECVANKNEAFLAFHQKDDAPISLFEMRLHMPTDEEGGVDKAEEFKKAVLAFAGLEAETEQPIALLSDILCMTPRGRYDIKVFPTSIALHGKTYDYKIPIKSITRLFLVPHKDGRHVYFVLSLNPPIRQGQTRYNYLVFEFIKDDDMDLELGLTDDQLQEQFNGALKREMSGPIYEIVSILFKIVCNLKVTVPGKFIGNTGTPAIQCSHKQNPGLLYPMEKGFLFIHKPAMYVRFDDISSCHFARSDAGTVTRTFDFELDLKNGTSLMFNSVEKEENNKLYDYLKKKNLKIRNAQRIDAKELDSSDDEIDPYKNKVKAEGRQRDESDSDSTDEDYDLDRDLKKQKADKDSSEGSGSEPDDEYDSGSEQDSSGTGESEPDDEEDVRPAKSKREPKEKKEKAEKKKGKKEKDPNAPKRAMSAYFLWFGANRLSLKKDGDSVADVAKKAGETWKKMGPDDKKEWEEKAAVDKKRYEAEMKEYKANGGGPSTSSGSSKKKASSSKKSSGPSPAKAKSKEFLSSDDSDDEDDEDEEPTKKKKKKAEKAKETSEEPESGDESEEEEEEDSD